MAAYVFGNKLVRVHDRGQSIYPAGIAIGLGLPLAAGAQAARPDRPVIALCGDGGFMLNVGELATVMQHDLPVVIVLLNDRGYDVLRRHQDRTFSGRRMAVDLHAPDFQALARSFGLSTLGVSRLADLEGSLKEAVAMRRPVLIEVDVTAIGPVPR